MHQGTLRIGLALLLVFGSFLLIVLLFSGKARAAAPSLEFPWPIGENSTVSVGFAAGSHRAIDFDFPNNVTGDEVLAAQSGAVVEAYDDGEWHQGYGNYVKIDHGNGYSTLYAHLADGTVRVEPLDYIVQGTVIGEVGSTGQSIGDHLHFELINGTTREQPIFSECACIPQEGSNYTSRNSFSNQVILFEHANYQGSQVAFEDVDGFFNLGTSFNDKASSLSIPDSWTVRLYKHSNGSDTSNERKTFYANDPDFSNDQFDDGTPLNDQVSALRIYILQCPADFSLSPASSASQCTVPTPTPQPPPPASGWNQTFFANNNLGSQCGLVRNETDVYMFRDSDSGWSLPPGCPGVESAWSVRMERSDAWFDGGNYEFGLFYDDAARLYVDGQLVVDGWNATQHYESRDISRGNHQLRLEYKNNAGHAIVQLWWRGPGALPHNTQTKDPNQWWVNYWGNQTQWQDAVGSQNEGTGFISRDWGYGGPGFGIPGDHFSTRFERSMYFDCGTYSFHLSSDDGSRLWIDGNLIPQFNHWTTNVWGTIADINVSAGPHTVMVDHFENGGAAHLQFDWYQVSSCPNPPILTSPSQFAEFDEEDGITLTWSGNGNQYYVEYQDTGGAYTANSGWQMGASWTIGTLPAGKVYTWRVKARNSSGESYWSAWHAFTVQPASPSNLVVPTLTCTGVTLSWRDNSSVEEGFNIYCDGVRIASVSADVSSFSDSNASGNVTHSYFVAAFIDNVESRASNTVSVYAPSCDGIPGDANGDGEVDGVDYVIWLNHYDTNTTLGPTEGDFNLDGTVDGVDYVIWLNNYGISVGNTTGTVNAPASVTSVPQAPGNLTLSYEANGSNTATIVQLSWSDNADNEDGFSLIWNTDGYGDIAVTTLANPPSTTLRPDTTSSVLTAIPCGSNSREWSSSASLSAFNTDGTSNQVSIQEAIVVPACPAVIATPTPTFTPQPSPTPSPTSMSFPDPTSTPVLLPTFTPTPIGYHVVHRYYLPLTVIE